MEELIKAGANELFTAICILGCIIATIGLFILKTVVDIKKMLKEHFGDDKKKED